MTVAKANDYELVISPYQQGTWGTRLVDGSLTVKYPLMSAQPANKKPIGRDDSEEIARGYEDASRYDVEGWELTLPVSVPLDSYVSAVLISLGLGACTSSGTGPNYSHVIKRSVPDTVSFQNPYTTFVEDASGVQRYLLDLVVADFELTGNIGERPTLNANLRGSGETADASGFSFPASFSSANFLYWTGLQFQLGESGSLVDVSSKIKSFGISHNNNLAVDESRAAGCGLYASRMEFGKKRETQLSLSMRREGTTELDYLANETEVKAVLTFTGRDLIDTGVYHSLTATFEKMQIVDTPKSYDNQGREVINPSIVHFHNSDDNGPIKIEIVNETAEFLASEA